MPNLGLTLRAWPVVTLLTIGLCFATEQVAAWFGITLPEQTTVEQMRTMGIETWRILTTEGVIAAFHNSVSRLFLINIPLVLAVMPITEELVFRGLLYKLPVVRLTRRFCNAPRALPVLVAILSAALFSAAHYLQMPWPNNAFIALFFFGLAQCWLYRRTNRIGCPMLNHALFNLTNLVLLFLVPEAAA